MLVIRLVLINCLLVPLTSTAEIENRARITNYDAKSNAAPARAVGCADITNLSSLYSPAELYPAVRKCVDKRKYDEAARLFSMAGAYGYYDSMRVDYEGAPHAIRYIQILSFQDVGKRKMKNFNTHLASDYAAGTQSHIALCTEMKKIGPPSYHPEYMIQHGMRSGLTSASSAMRAEFDAGQAWRQTLTRYLGCMIYE